MRIHTPKVLFLALVLIYNPAIAMMRIAKAGRLPQQAHTTKAHNVLHKTVTEFILLPGDNTKKLEKYLPADEIKRFCKKQITNWKQFKINQLNVEENLRVLCPENIRLHAIAYLPEGHPTVEFLYGFATASRELVAHRARRILKCRIGELEDFENDYAHQLEIVTPEEFYTRKQSISNREFECLLLQEAALLAAQLLKTLPNAKL